MQISRVDAPATNGGENPLWDADAQALFYIDNFGKKIHRYDPASGESRTWHTPSVVTTLVLRAGGGAVVTMHSGVAFFDFATGAVDMLHPLADPPPYVYNDGTVDARGRFLFGGCTAQFDDPTPEGGLYRLDPDRSLTRLDSGIHFSNSACFAPDGKTFYFSDSWLKTTYAYDYDVETGTVVNRRVFVTTHDLGGLPDGSTVDADGLVWITIYGGGRIAAFRPDGKLERTIDMPVKLVSSVAFGGADLDRLYVTSIAHGALGEPPEEGAGALFAVDGLGVRGLPEFKFAG